MNEMTAGNNALQVNRNPLIIAAEINSIKEQTQKMVLYNSIEIGRRLVEAKGMIEHGEWGTWLEKSVDYSQRTAQNLMRIFEEYGADQIAFFGNNANSQALANLSYTQAVALLGVPAEEREQFVEDHDMEAMTTRELQQAIKERDQALNEKSELERKLGIAKINVQTIAEERNKLQEETADLKSKVSITDKALKDKQDTVKMLQDELQKERDRTKSEVDRLVGLLNEARANGTSDEKVKQLEAELNEARIQVQLLNDRLNEPVTLEPAIIEKVPEDVERELHELRVKTRELEAKNAQQGNPAIRKYSVHFELLVKGFSELLGALSEVKETAPEEYEKYKGAVTKLISKMSERL